MDDYVPSGTINSLAMGYSHARLSPPQQSNVDLHTIAQPSTATNSDSSDSGTMILESYDDNGYHGSMHQNFSGGSEEMNVVEIDPQYLYQVCYGKEVKVLLLPCRHTKMYESHIIIDQKKPCPHCQAPVEKIQTIYL